MAPAAATATATPATVTEPAATVDAAASEAVSAYDMTITNETATAPYDAYGSFTVEDASQVPVDADGRTISVKELELAFDDLSQDPDTHVVDKRVMPAEDTRFGFVLQTMRQYILLRQAARSGLI